MTKSTATKAPRKSKAVVQLSDADKRQIADEAASRGVQPKHDDGFEMTAEELAKQNRGVAEKAAQQDAIVEGRTANLDTLPITGIPGSERCPHCGERCHENVSSGSFINTQDGGEAVREHVCDSCGGEWGPKLATATPTPAAAVQVHNIELPKAGDDGRCPHCKSSTRNGKNVTEFSEMAPSAQNTTTQQFTCDDCAGEWGPVVDKPKKARAPSGTSNGLKIEANRDNQNGVSRPSAGGKCRAVWDMLDAEGADVTAKRAREVAEQKGFDRTTTMVQFYRWRKFNGIAGRQ